MQRLTMKGDNMKTILSAAIGAMLALSAIDAGAQAKAADRKVELAIEQQSLADALNEWAKQTGLQLVSSTSEMMNTTVAPRVKGEYTAKGALEELLKGTSLTYEWVSERAVAIREKSPIVPAALQSSDADRKQATVPIARFSGETGKERRVAANDQSDSGAGESTPRNRGERDRGNAEELEEVVVTGTHIAGSGSAGSRVITLNREYIAKSGYATVEGLLKTLPQNFSGGVAEAQSVQFSDTTAGNFNEGTAVNLRGLGVDSTLVLIDGRRQPGSGISGAFVDISSIPLSAIERVEILPDGASAVYGSDAIGGVVNFILRKDFDGAESNVRFGDAEGGADQVQVSQIFGHSWSTGSAVLDYQYDHRDRLPRSERANSASDDLRPFGGSDFRVFASNPGNILDPATRAPAFAIPHGQDGTSLEAGDLLPGVINYDSSSRHADLFAEQEMHSAFLSLSQRLGDRLELFADGRFASREVSRIAPAQIATLRVPSSNPFYVNPFGGTAPILVAYNFSSDVGMGTGEGTVDTYAGTVGASVDLTDSWKLSLYGNYGREDTVSRSFNQLQGSALNSALADPNPATAFNPFADGSGTSEATLASIRTSSRRTTEAQMRNGNMVLTGPLFRIGSRASMLALGLDVRDEDVDSLVVSTRETRNKMGREVKAAFVEVALPLVTSGNYPAIRELSLSLAGRYEDYSDFGTTFNERVGISWSPVESLKVRATWGTSFKAPRLNQLLTTYPEAFDFYLPLPSPNGPPVDSLIRFGNNPELREETADVWSAGVEWSPTSLPLLHTSLTFWQINYRDRVAVPGPTGSPLQVLFQAETWAEVINFNPTRTQLDAVCRSPTFVNPGNPVTVDECLTRAPAALVDLRLRNLAAVRVEGVDLDARYQFDTRVGAISLGLNGTYMPSYDRQITRNSPEIDISNTTGNVLRLRLRGDVSWSRGGWDVGAFVNYANSYDDTFSVSGQPIDAWTTVDGRVRYRFEQSGGALGGLTVALNALNVFDKDQPFANVGVPNYPFGYDTANANPYGRVLSLQLTKVWGR